MRRSWMAVAMLGALLACACGRTSRDTSDADSGRGGRPGAGGIAGATALAGGTTTGASPGVGGSRELPPDGEVPPPMALHKLDLLLMIDNSHQMAEKQRLLKDAVAWLLGPTGPLRSVDDLHVGIVTSSLGPHGAAGARDVCVTVEDNDHAHLIGSVRPGLRSFQNSGFLAWGPDAEPDLDLMLLDLDPMMYAVGQHGCGYEASLEAWYRFLVDPEPPGSVSVPAGQTTAVVADIDATTLAQRAAFLRPDSVLAIVMLTDENDCSIQDEGYGWLVARSAPMYRATSACATNPNDPCCQSCAETTANRGCPAVASDPACSGGVTLGSEDDDLNLRCWDQKRRFGFDLLQPISRYRDALTRQLVLQRATGQPVPNPIFSAGSQGRRHPSQVILTGIVGVPWQDLADEASLSGPGLSNLSANQLEEQGRWQLMLGDPNASPPVPPKDPFMIEAPFDRTSLSVARVHPLTADSLVPSDSQNPLENSVNGHEAVNIGSRALQSACIFRLMAPRLCDQAAFDADRDCQCFIEDAPYNNAMCQPPSGGPASNTQYFDNAYPGLRHLELLRSLGDNAVTASICPKVTEPGEADYGYRPAMAVLGARLERALNP